MKRLYDNLPRVFDSEIGARGLASVWWFWILGGRVALVWIVGEMNHTELQRVIWQGRTQMTAIVDRVERGCEDARVVSTMLR